MRARSRAIGALVMLTTGVALGAQTADRGRTEAQARRVSDRIRALQTEADRLAGEERTLLGDLRRLQIEQQVQVERVEEAQAGVAQAQAAVEQTAGRFAALEQQRVAQLPDMKAQLVDIYKRGRAGYARLLFGAGSVREFGRATRAIAALLRINEERLENHRRTLESLSQERATLEEHLRVLRTHEAEARQAQTAADRALTARTALIAQIDARRDLNAQFAGELQVAYERLQQQVVSRGTGRPVEEVAIPLAPFRGALDWPVPGGITVRFGQLSGRFGDTTAGNGVHIAAPAGTPVHAVHSGIVSFADAFTGFGNLVIVDHGATAVSLYGYLDSLSVVRGDAVDSGTEVGRVGSPPVGPAAVYLEIRIDGRSVDPVQWLKPR